MENRRSSYGSSSSDPMALKGGQIGEGAGATSVLGSATTGNSTKGTGTWDIWLGYPQSSSLRSFSGAQGQSGPPPADGVNSRRQNSTGAITDTVGHTGSSAWPSPDVWRRSSLLTDTGPDNEINGYKNGHKQSFTDNRGTSVVNTAPSSRKNSFVTPFFNNTSAVGTADDSKPAVITSPDWADGRLDSAPKYQIVSDAQKPSYLKGTLSERFAQIAEATREAELATSMDKFSFNDNNSLLRPRTELSSPRINQTATLNRVSTTSASAAASPFTSPTPSFTSPLSNTSFVANSTAMPTAAPNDFGQPMSQHASRSSSLGSTTWNGAGGDDLNLGGFPPSVPLGAFSPGIKQETLSKGPTSQFFPSQQSPEYLQQQDASPFLNPGGTPGAIMRQSPSANVISPIFNGNTSNALHSKGRKAFDGVSPRSEYLQPAVPSRSEVAPDAQIPTASNGRSISNTQKHNHPSQPSNHKHSKQNGADNDRLQNSHISRSHVLEEFRNSKTKKYELQDIIGYVVEFSCDQHGSRFIQHKLETASDQEKQSVFDELEPKALSLMTDVFGNYVVQKFFELGNTSQRSVLAKRLESNILSLSLQMYGCRVVQKALEYILTEEQAVLVQELDGHVLKCVKDQNGNHVIQKAIERVPLKYIGFIMTAFSDRAFELATHPYGCRVIQRMLENCDENTQQLLLDEIHDRCYDLIDDQYGNYVIQHVVERGKPVDRGKIVKIVRGSLVNFSRHKFASNVVEKCIVYGSNEERKDIINDILTPRPDGQLPIAIMMKDQFANYVVQKLLDMSTGRERTRLVQEIRPQLMALKKSNYGKHLTSIEKLLAISGEFKGL